MAPIISTSVVMVEKSCQIPPLDNHGEDSQHYTKQSRLQTVAIVISAASATTIGSILSGLMTVILPQVIKDFDLSPNLVLW